MNKMETLLTASIIGTVGVGLYSFTNIDEVEAKSITVMTTTANVHLREKPTKQSKSLGIVKEGLEVGVVSFTENGWAKLENGNYICGAYLVKSNNQNDTNTYKYTTCNLNLRKGPSTNYAKILTIPKGSKLTCLNESNGFVKVKYNGYVGWCCKQYLSNNIVSNNQSKTFIDKIYIDKSKHILYCYSNGKCIKSFPCAVGKKSTPTPSGKFNVIDKVKNRPYYKGGIPGGSSKNPLGTRAIQLTVSGIFIHGNNDKSSIGKDVSNGCIRMYNEDIEWLYDRIASYKTIVIIY